MWIFKKTANTNEPTFFIIKLFCDDCSLADILRQQFQLSRKANINISETEMMADFEREVYINLLLEDLKREKEQLENYK